MIIREVSEKTDISIDNLRYYERIGLIPPVPRTESGIGNYDEMSIHWIEFAMRFKKAEVPLEAIHEYIQLAMQGESTKEARREILVETKEGLEKKCVTYKKRWMLLITKLILMIRSVNLLQMN